VSSPPGAQPFVAVDGGDEADLELSSRTGRVKLKSAPLASLSSMNFSAASPPPPVRPARSTTQAPVSVPDFWRQFAAVADAGADDDVMRVRSATTLPASSHATSNPPALSAPSGSDSGVSARLRAGTSPASPSGDIPREYTTDQIRKHKKRKSGSRRAGFFSRGSGSGSAASSSSSAGNAPTKHTKRLMKEIAKFQLEGYAEKHFARHKHGVFRRQIPIREMLQFDSQPLSQPLLRLHDSGQARQAVALFKKLQKASGVRGECKEPAKLLRDIVCAGLSTAELRDEIYCQIAKMLTAVPSSYAHTEAVTWQAFVLAVQYFPPTKNLLEWLHTFAAGRTKALAKKRGADDELALSAAYCAHKLPLIASSRRAMPSLVEIDQARTYALNSPVFAEDLELLIERQRQTHPDLDVPLVLVTFVDTIKRLGGFATEGLFRVPGDNEKIGRVRLQIDRHDYDVSTTLNDVHSAASLLKLWLRQLPVAPFADFERCIAVARDPARVVDMALHLKSPHRELIRYIVHFLQELIEHQATTKMTKSNVAVVFAPNLVRVPSDAPVDVVLRAAKDQMDFLVSLIDAYPKS
jgi:Rho GTPase-activating protein 39